MARPRKFDEGQVLESIKNIFWDKGYEGTSYPDLIAASGLHKGSLYAAFGDKRSLYLRALRHYDEQEVTQAIAILNGEDGTKNRIATLFNIVINALRHRDLRGCLLCNAAVDQALHDDDVKNSVSRSISKMLVAFETALREEHSHISDHNRKTVASHMNSVYFGMRVIAKSGLDIDILERARDGAIYSITAA